MLSAVAFVSPGISEVVVGVVTCRSEGLGSPYCLALLAYGGLMVTNWLGLWLLSSSSYAEE